MTGSTDGATTLAYQYDHEGNRVRKSSGSSVTVYPNTYYDIEDSTVRRHITAGVLGGIATSTWDGSTSEVVYHHKDHLGSTHVETDESGAVLEYLLYKPFGETLVDVQSGGYENDRKYTGKELDDDTNYHYHGARYYKADIGRFLSQDPAYLVVGANKKVSDLVLRDPQLMNSYAYARNNPIMMIDSDGRWPSLSSIMRGINAVGNAVDKVYNAITFGASDKAAEMGKTGVTVGGVAHVVGGVTYGTVTTSLLALDVGAAAGALAIDVGVVVSRQQTVQSKAAIVTESAVIAKENLSNAGGKVVNDTVKIPATWTMKPTRANGGTMYINPENSRENIRLMPGNPNSRYPVAQQPYWRHQVNGGYLDSSGKINPDNSATHFPIRSIK